MVESSTDCLVTCSSLVSQATDNSQLMFKLYRSETSLLCAETRLGLPYLSLSYCRQLHSGLYWLESCGLSLLMRNPSSALSLYSASCPSWRSTGGYNTSTGRHETRDNLQSLVLPFILLFVESYPHLSSFM